MSLSGAQLVVTSAGNQWTKVVLVALFTAGLVLVLLVPFVTDIRRAHATWDKLLENGKTPPAGIKGPIGLKGVARATMALGVITVIGFALGYILVEKPFADNRTIVGNIVVALTTTLAAITAFYFGSKQASDARAETHPQDKAEEEKKT